MGASPKGDDMDSRGREFEKTRQQWAAERGRLESELREQMETVGFLSDRITELEDEKTLAALGAARPPASYIFPADTRIEFVVIDAEGDEIQPRHLEDAPWVKYKLHRPCEFSLDDGGGFSLVGRQGDAIPVPENLRKKWRIILKIIGEHSEHRHAAPEQLERDSEGNAQPHD